MASVFSHLESLLRLNYVEDSWGVNSLSRRWLRWLHSGTGEGGRCSLSWGILQVRVGHQRQRRPHVQWPRVPHLLLLLPGGHSPGHQLWTHRRPAHLQIKSVAGKMSSSLHYLPPAFYIAIIFFSRSLLFVQMLVTFLQSFYRFLRNSGKIAGLGMLQITQDFLVCFFFPVTTFCDEP